MSGNGSAAALCSAVKLWRCRCDCQPCLLWSARKHSQPQHTAANHWGDTMRFSGRTQSCAGCWCLSVAPEVDSCASCCTNFIPPLLRLETHQQKHGVRGVMRHRCGWLCVLAAAGFPSLSWPSSVVTQIPPRHAAAQYHHSRAYRLPDIIHHRCGCQVPPSYPGYLRASRPKCRQDSTGTSTSCRMLSYWSRGRHMLRMVVCWEARNGVLSDE